MHIFEEAGLGIAPFTYMGLEYQEIKYGERSLGSVGGVEMTTKPGGTCAYCGQYIVNMFKIRGSDGSEFHVGSDCVLKTGDKGLLQPVKVAIATKRKLQAMARREGKLLADTCLSVYMVENHADALRAFDHPNEAMAKAGKTLLDYCQWCVRVGAYGPAANNIRGYETLLNLFQNRETI